MSYYYYSYKLNGVENENLNIFNLLLPSHLPNFTPRLDLTFRFGFGGVLTLTNISVLPVLSNTAEAHSSQLTKLSVFYLLLLFWFLKKESAYIHTYIHTYTLPSRLKSPHFVLFSREKEKKKRCENHLRVCFSRGKETFKI